jgi:hypothetical protein
MNMIYLNVHKSWLVKTFYYVLVTCSTKNLGNKNAKRNKYWCRVLSEKNL